MGSWAGQRIRMAEKHARDHTAEHGQPFSRGGAREQPTQRPIKHGRGFWSPRPPTQPTSGNLEAARVVAGPRCNPPTARGFPLHDSKFRTPRGDARVSQPMPARRTHQRSDENISAKQPTARSAVERAVRPGLNPVRLTVTLRIGI